jgi:hypothetical protein
MSHECSKTFLLIALTAISFAPTAKTAAFKITSDFSKPTTKNAEIRWDCPAALAIHPIVPASEEAVGVGKFHVGENFIQGVACETDAILISLDNKVYRLEGRGIETEFKQGFRRSYVNKSQGVSVRILHKSIVEKHYASDTDCTEERRMVEVVVRKKKAERTVQAMVMGGCPF